MSVHGESVQDESAGLLDKKVLFLLFPLHLWERMLSPPLPLETVSQLGFEVVAASFSLRKLLKFNISFSQTKVCGYKKSNCDTHSWGREY